MFQVLYTKYPSRISKTPQINDVFHIVDCFLSSSPKTFTTCFRQKQQNDDERLKSSRSQRQNASPWFIKLAGYQLMNASKEHYKSLSEEANTKLNTIEKEGNAVKISELEAQISKHNARAKELSDAISSLKEKETDAQVLQYLKQILGE